MPVSATASSIQTVGDPARPQTDLTFLGELASIAQQVEQYLPQPHGVHDQCAKVLLGVEKEDVLEGIERMPEAFLRLLHGEKLWKTDHKDPLRANRAAESKTSRPTRLVTSKLELVGGTLC